MNRLVREASFGFFVNYSVPLTLIANGLSSDTEAASSSLQFAAIASSAFFVFQLIIQTLIYRDLLSKSFFTPANLIMCGLGGISIVFAFGLENNSILILSLFSPLSYVLSVMKSYLSEDECHYNNTFTFLLVSVALTCMFVLFVEIDIWFSALEIVAFVRIIVGILSLILMYSRNYGFEKSYDYNFLTWILPFSGVLLIFFERWYYAEILSHTGLSAVWLIISEWVYRSAGLLNLFQYSIINALQKNKRLDRPFIIISLFLICNVAYCFYLYLFATEASYLLVQGQSIVLGSCLMLYLIARDKLDVLGKIWLLELVILMISYWFLRPFLEYSSANVTIVRFILDTNFLLLGVLYVERKQDTV
ncbi:hypothetical protein N9Y85_05090 [Paracoccaceae bacterium]|nr:hypothetical protein [Paracoccaceae bacterium]